MKKEELNHILAASRSPKTPLIVVWGTGFSYDLLIGVRAGRGATGDFHAFGHRKRAR